VFATSIVTKVSQNSLWVWPDNDLTCRFQISASFVIVDVIVISPEGGDRDHHETKEKPSTETKLTYENLDAYKCV